VRRRMMTWCAGLLILIPVLAASAQESVARAPRADDEMAIVKTLEQMFSAAQRDDMDRFHAATTKDFYAYDNGKRFDGDALMELIKQYHVKGYQYLWSVTEPQVHVNCDIAWVTYVNKGSIRQPDGTMTGMMWLESAVMRWDGNTWKVRFLHSTRVPPEQAPVNASH
jgi:ketosteroid isomerase-like protein